MLLFNWILNSCTSGERGKGIRWTKGEKSIPQVFKQALLKAGIEKPASLYWLHQIYASHLLERDICLRYIKIFWATLAPDQQNSIPISEFQICSRFEAYLTIYRKLEYEMIQAYTLNEVVWGCKLWSYK